MSQIETSWALATSVCHAWADGSERRIVVLHGPSGGGKSPLAADAMRRMTARSGVLPSVWTAAALIDTHIEAILRHTMDGLPQRCVAPGGALVVEHMEDLRERSHTFECIMHTVGVLHRGGHPVLLTVTRMPPGSLQVLRWLWRAQHTGADLIMVPARAPRQLPQRAMPPT